MIKNLTKEEEQMIEIFRLVKKINKKFGQQYFRIENSNDHINRHFYFTYHGSCNFDTAEETIEELKFILELPSDIEYTRYCVSEANKKRIKNLEKNKKEIETEIEKLNNWVKWGVIK